MPENSISSGGKAVSWSLPSTPSKYLRSARKSHQRSCRQRASRSATHLCVALDHVRHRLGSRMNYPPHSGRLALEVFARQRAIDPKRRPCAFSGSNDRELHVLDDIACHENARAHSWLRAGRSEHRPCG